MNYYFEVLKKYAVFSGRARRKEYWTFVLFNILVVFVIIFVERILGVSGLLSNIYRLAVIIPTIAVAVRRMHDVGKSGWFYLIPIYDLILACTDGTKGPNQYGPDPKEVATMPVDSVPPTAV